MASTNLARPSAERTRGQIESDMSATRQRLAGSLESLIDVVHPNRIKQRTVATVKQRVNEQVANGKALVFNARGDLRKDRLAIAGGGLAGFIAFVTIVRAIARRGRD